MSRGGWSRWRATVVVFCVRCLCCCEKDKRRWWRMRAKKNNGRSARFGRSWRCRFSCVGLNRFSMLTFGDRQSRHWRRDNCVRLSRCVVVVARARVRGEGRFFFVFFLFFLFCCGARCCALLWWRAVDGVCALLGAVCVTRRCVRDSTLEALGAVCAART